MSKKTSKYRTYRKKRSTSKRKHSTSKKYRKHRRSNALAKGAASDAVNCCICGIKIRMEDGLIPAKCYRKMAPLEATEFARNVGSTNSQKKASIIVAQVA